MNDCDVRWHGVLGFAKTAQPMLPQLKLLQRIVCDLLLSGT